MWKLALRLLCVSSLCLTVLGGVYNATVPEYVAEVESEEVLEELDNLTSVAPETEQILKEVPGRIVNGTKAEKGQFPHQVSLRRRYSQSHFCGGNILTKEWILTAGHCMFDKFLHELEPYTIIVVAGEIALKNTNAARHWSYVSQLIVHPSFDYPSLTNDIALIKMETPIIFDEFMKPAVIPQLDFEPGTKCQVAGWGYPKYEVQIVSGTLMFVDVPLIPIPVCRELLAEYSSIPPGSFCAGYVEGGKDACQGDSGGGLVCKGYLTGTVSGGHGCAWPLLPGIYSDVRYYIPWIKKYVNLTENLYSRSSASLTTTSISVFALVTAILYLNYEA